MYIKDEFWTLSKSNVYVAAHRGFSAEYPENTMPSFAAALDCGVDQLETDVRMTSDGELVLIHDETVNRTTNGTGLVSQMTFEELRKLDASNGKRGFEGVRIPTLEEFLDLAVKRNLKTLDIELKVYPLPGQESVSYSVCDRTLAMLEKYGFDGRFVINTFSGKLHEYINKKYDGKYLQHVYWPKGYLGNEMTLDPYDYAFCCCMFGNEPGNMASAEDFENMKKMGVSPWAGAGVKDFDTVKNAVLHGAELITCNNPDTVIKCLKELGVR